MQLFHISVLGVLLLAYLGNAQRSGGVSEATYEYTLPPLPYYYGSLQPYISRETMQFHHDKHHQAYVDNLNKALADYPELQELTLGELLGLVGTGQLPKEIESAVRNNGGGHWNHSFFWKIMDSPRNGSKPTGALEEAIIDSFGSVDAMKEEFNAAASSRFGSGWAWLVKNPSGELMVTSTANQDNPLMCGNIASVTGTPILALDVWEHAYYLDYQNLRKDYINNWWNVVNWPEAERIFSA